jgi:AraC-like DNA-binding protein
MPPASAADLLDRDDGPLVITRAGAKRGEHTAAHSHARGQLIACQRGVLSVETGGRTWIVPARHALWLPPHHVHASRMLRPFHGWTLYLARPACAELPDRACLFAVTPLLWEAAMRSAQWPLVRRTPAHDRLAQVILDELRDLRPHAHALAMPRDPRLVRIAGEVLREPGAERSLDGWARIGGLSSRTLSRRFVEETSLTFRAWVQRARLIRALELLADGAAVTSIAIELGYASVSAFIARFKLTLGVTPAAYARGERR